MKVVIKKYWRVSILLLFSTITACVWYGVYCETPTKYLTVRFLDIGQGDAIYIESPEHNKLLIDGGPEHSLLPELKKYLPFYTKNIDMFLNTNPDIDHYAGMLDMFSEYHIGKILEAGTVSDTSTYSQFEKEIKDRNIPKVLAKRGMIIHLGSGADLHILFPDRDVSDLSTNDGSVMAKLTYGSTSVMFAGDAPNKTEEYVLSLEGTSSIRSTILKAGHHGSRTSASSPFISAVNPQYAVISAGLKNKYGHPHKETTELFNSLNIPMLVTFKTGTITARSDGTFFAIKTEK